MPHSQVGEGVHREVAEGVEPHLGVVDVRGVGGGQLRQGFGGPATWTGSRAALDVAADACGGAAFIGTLAAVITVATANRAAMFCE